MAALASDLPGDPGPASATAARADAAPAAPGATSASGESVIGGAAPFDSGPASAGAALAGIAHGTDSPTGRAAVAALMSAVAEARPGLRTALGFVDVQHPDVAETLAALPPEPGVTLVPLLLSAGYHVHVDLSEAVAEHPNRALTLADALGPDPRLAGLLMGRLYEAGLRDDDAVVLAVAGSSDARAVDDCRLAGDLLAAELGRPVRVGFLSAAEPRLTDAVSAARAQHPAGRVAVSSYLLAPGYFHDLTTRAGGDVTAAPLLAGDEVPPELVSIVLDRYDRCTECRACGRLCARTA